MELWIRTQDKECLMKIHRVDYDLSNSQHSIIVNGYETLVGHYKTRERALEVLDEIESLLILKQGVKFTGDGLYSVENNLAIYEMPEN